MNSKFPLQFGPDGNPKKPINLEKSKSSSKANSTKNIKSMSQPVQSDKKTEKTEKTEKAEKFERSLYSFETASKCNTPDPFVRTTNNAVEFSFFEEQPSLSKYGVVGWPGFTGSGMSPESTTQSTSSRPLAEHSYAIRRNYLKKQINDWFKENVDSDIKFISHEGNKIIIWMTHNKKHNIIEITSPFDYPVNKKGFSCREIHVAGIIPLNFIPKVNRQFENKILTFDKIMTYLAKAFSDYKMNNNDDYVNVHEDSTLKLIQATNNLVIKTTRHLEVSERNTEWKLSKMRRDIACLRMQNVDLSKKVHKLTKMHEFAIPSKKRKAHASEHIVNKKRKRQETVVIEDDIVKK